MENNNVPNLAKAVLAVMKKVKGIDKTMTVGEGKNSYKGVSDQLVKQQIGDAMHEHGLTIMPIGVEAKTQIDRWEETTVYNNTPQTKTKQSVFVETKTKYLLLHESGESVVLEGYGHGVDSQDKAAGKATTYALKYTLLYTFLVPTGKIDDTDNEHSDDKTPPPPKQPKQPDLKIEYTAEIAKAIDDCTSPEQVAEIWDKYIPLQKNEDFKRDISNKGKFLKLQQK